MKRELCDTISIKTTVTTMFGRTKVVHGQFVAWDQPCFTNFGRLLDGEDVLETLCLWLRCAWVEWKERLKSVCALLRVEFRISFADHIY